MCSTFSCLYSYQNIKFDFLARIPETCKDKYEEENEKLKSVL